MAGHSKTGQEGLELLETSVNNGQETYYHITKSFRVVNGKLKMYPLSEAAAFLNSLRFRKGLLWGGAAFLSLTACSIIVILLI